MKAEVSEKKQKKKGPREGKNAKSGFNVKLDKIKQQRAEEEENKVKAKAAFEKKLKQKSRYSKQLNRRNHKGQMVMSGMIAHYLNKIQ